MQRSVSGAEADLNEIRVKHRALSTGFNPWLK